MKSIKNRWPVSSNVEHKSENNMNTRRTSSALALALTAALAAQVGCGLTPATDIDRVQPNYTDKELFKGEWYSRFMVVDKDYANSWLFEGFEGGMERVRWEISMETLTAYRSYEFSPGTESDDPGDNTVIAQFPIIKHFDITRQYNAYNGVENNVIVENDYDKPWWERQYIRVDWSNNMAKEFTGGTISGLMKDVTWTTNTRNSNAEPTNPWKVRVTPDYIETTVEGVAYPDYAVCYNQLNDWNCAPAAIRGKFSFRKIDQDDDYVPMEYPDRKPMYFGFQENVFGDVTLCFEGDADCELRELWVHDSGYIFETCDLNDHDPDDCFQYTQDVFTKFGFFRTERYAYDRENGTTVETREQLINRWNIWKQSIDENGNVIPYSQREPKTIVYHYNVGFPESMKEATRAQEADWNQAFLDTIANLQGKSVQDVQNEYATGDRLFRAYEIRENSCNVTAVNEYVEDMKDKFDFETALMSEGIRLKDLGPGNLEEACAVLEHYGKQNDVGVGKVFQWEQLGDLRYSFINWVATPEPAGPLGYGPSAADPITGEIVSANANIYGASLDTYANWGADIVQVLNGELDTNDIINGTHVREYIDSVRAKHNQRATMEDGLAFLKKMESRTAYMTDEQFLPEKPMASINGNLNRVRDSNWEEQYMLNEDAIRLFGGGAADAAGQHSAEAIKAAMPSTWGKTVIPGQFKINELSEQLAAQDRAMDNMESFRARRELYNRNNFCYFQDEVEPAVIELATELKDMSREDALRVIREGIMRGVLAHEVGHTVGLRHNFEGSADPLNYFPGYWDVTTGDHRDSTNTRKSELEYSSIMDYHQRFNSDFSGIGLYDKAAIKFGYGELVEVFDEREGVFASQNFPANAFWLFYPGDLAYLLAGPDAHAAIRQRYEDINDEITFDGQNETILNVQDLGITPNYDNLYKRRNVTFKDWSRQDVMRIFSVSNPDGSPLMVDVPYAYCSDGFAWGGNLTCNRFDKGATSEEIVRNASEMYEFYDPFYTFLGSRVNLSAASWQARLYERIYQPMRNSFTYYFYYRRSTALIYPTFLDWAITAHDGLNFLAGVVQRPDVGTYCLDGGIYRPESEMGANCANPVDVPLGPGRVFDTLYTPDEAFRLKHIGHVWDKSLALNAMTSTDAFFYRDFSNQVDRSAFSISFYRVFQDEMVKFFTDLILNRPSEFAPQVRLDGDMVEGIETTPLVSFRDSEEIPMAGPMIKPKTNYYMQRAALLWSMVGFTSTLDQTLDFGKRAKVSIVGSANDPVFEGVPEAVFQDPYSLVDYHSYAIDGDENSLGYAILTDLNDFVQNEWVDGDPASDAQLNDKLETLEALRYITDVLEDANN